MMKCLLPFVLILLTVGCSRPEPDEITTEAEPENHTIDWFEGSVEEAFEQARQEDKPLFLYWGAVWCPPCNQLKATLFKQHNFIAQTRLFVPVYLDGDTERAQYYGDRFAVEGYPTLVLFQPDGTEITRIPGGMELKRYQSVMQLALQQVKPVRNLVVEATGGSAKLSQDDCRLLAYYSWDQDNQQVLGKGKTAGTIYKLYNACPSSAAEEKSRLFMDYLNAWLRENRPEGQAEQRLVVDEEFRKRTLAEINKILSNPDLVLANVYTLRYEDGNIVRALTEPDSKERAKLIQNWRNALEVISNTESLSQMERLGTLYAEVSFNKLEHGGNVSDELKAEIRARVEAARVSVRNKYEQSAVINMVINVLNHAGMFDYEQQVVAQEVNNAGSPYYLMLELAELARREGRVDDALSWLEKAYRKSKPGATRFQWGVNYLVGLLEMTPNDESKIQNLATQLIQNLGNSSDAFYNRNATRLEQMSEKLQLWNDDGKHNTAIFAIRNNIQSLCSQLEFGSSEYSRCDSFLAGFAG